MYIQFRKRNNSNICDIVAISPYTDIETERLISGIYDNDKTEFELLEKYIFKDLIETDIIQKSNSTILRPIFDNGTVREMTREEVCKSGDLSVLNDGEVWEDDEIKVIPKPDGLKIEWIYPNWLETATDSEIYIDKLKKEYIEYKEIDTPSILREMELTDASIVDEYILIMIELRELISNYNMGISTISDIPTPSKALVDFKNRIKNIL